MRILSIESTCDDTAVTLLQAAQEGFEILQEKKASQIDVHKKYGGVVPEIAGRKHAEKITPTIEEVMEGQNKPDVIAVSRGPGLMTGLMVGVEAAKTLSYLWDKKLVGVNHMEGHIYSTKIQDAKKKTNKTFEFPILALLVSGGHTELILMTDHGEYEKIGATVDDAVGEALDKVANMLELPYPGGPKIEELAQDGDKGQINFPRPMIDSGDYNFSFSGLKTAARYWLEDNDGLAAMETTEKPTYGALKSEAIGVKSHTTIQDFCASFQQAVIDVLVEKSYNAIEEYNPKQFIVAGGVSANKTLRENLNLKLKQMKAKYRPEILYPLQEYCMDNATMIAVAGYYQAKQGSYIGWKKLEADPNLSL